MIRVLHVIDSLDLGGAQTVILQIAQQLNRNRFVMEVASMHGRGFFTERLEAENVKVHCLSSSKHLPLYVPNFMRLVASRSYDIFHFHLFGANWIAKPLAALMGKRRLVAHDHCNDRYRAENPLHIGIDRLTNRCSNKILAVSQSTADFLTQVERIEASKVTYLPNGMDMERFQPAAPEVRMQNRNRLGIPESACVIGGIGRLHPQKNFPLFLEIAAHLKKEADIFPIIAGTGPEEDMLREKARSLNLAEHSLFAGLVSDMPAFYSTLDMLLLTSDYEGMPMTLLEAMAAGIPVVGPSLDGVKEVIRDGTSGFLAEPGNKEEFIQKTRILATDRPLREKFGAAARQHIQTHFDIRNTVSRLEELYLKMMKDG